VDGECLRTGGGQAHSFFTRRSQGILSKLGAVAMA
jgi:hypothetical protein